MFVVRLKWVFNNIFHFEFLSDPSSYALYRENAVTKMSLQCAPKQIDFLKFPITEIIPNGSRLLVTFMTFIEKMV